ncbi:hypothetical protein EV363DRAFT_1271150 [Boletus edulis]|uniref:Uncharacterized protein n=1 Tax=Boletus edulis BED1 TaxID=1328754 RepID=A0AAD4GBJ8_BOLED|nr:hypothetical protein EV363DRAFT_1271150 [Boletus edulis]KAF8434733.1 hypothetical protein L210DRAFT_3552147 [Boletus edulis BED1]
MGPFTQLATRRSCGHIYYPCPAHAGSASVLAMQTNSLRALPTNPRTAISDLAPGGALYPDSECFAEHKGRYCVCGAVWVCDACLIIDSESENEPNLISCPACTQTYCLRDDGCWYCHFHFCPICYRTSICFGCQARENRDVGLEDKSGEVLQHLNVDERCRKCRCWICNECCSAAKVSVTRCSVCHQWTYGHCAKGRNWCRFCS